jgi:hypothetical protein
MKKTALILLLIFVSVSSVIAFDLGRFSFTIQPKIPTDDGSFSDYGIGFRYADRIATEIRLNITEKRTNEEFSGIDNSLNAVVHSEWRWFFIPFQYSFIKNEKTVFSSVLGGYYYREKLDENGYFQLASLDTPVNAYINHFSMNLGGPIIETEFSHAFNHFFRLTARAEAAPFAFYNAQQRIDIIPLFDFSDFSHSQSNSGAMYFYGRLTARFFDLVDIAAAYTGSFMPFDVVDFDSDFNVLVSGKDSYSQSIQIEGALNFKLDIFTVNLGIGGIFNAVYLDSTLTTEGKRLYFVFGAKKPFR